MSQNPGPVAAILTLDAEKIGDALVRLGLVAHQLGHQRVTDSLRPYCNHPEQMSPETRFVYDLYIRRVPEIISRWYGGESVANEILYKTIPAAFEPDPA